MVCFNAATTRRPWRTDAHQFAEDFRQIASMRPRPEGRGERPTVRTVSAAVEASMRPRPEGRGEPQDRYGQALHTRRASMRPRPEGRGERRLRRGEFTPALGASMRPRPEGRGERGRIRRGGRLALDSMRPRPEGRGEPPKTKTMKTSASRLQCGHDPKAVENIAAKESHPRVSSRFNAATTRRPWRTRCPRRRERARGAASMRPRPEGRGERSGRTVVKTVQITASMRPRPEGRGER